MGKRQDRSTNGDFAPIVGVFVQNLPRNEMGQLKLPVTLKSTLVGPDQWQKAQAQPQKFQSAFNSVGKDVGFKVAIGKDFVSFRERD